MGKVHRRQARRGRAAVAFGKASQSGRLFIEGLERRRLLSASTITSLTWQGQAVKAVQDSWVVRMPATNSRGTATPLDDVYASPNVPAGWTVKSLGYGFQQVTAPGVSLQNVSSWAKANKALYVEPSVVRDKPASTFSTVRLPSTGVARTLAAAPNDPSFNQQWALSNTGQNGGKVGADMSALSAWDITTGSSAAVVAVMDTGVDYRHPDLAGNMWTRPANIPASVVGVNGYDTGDDDADPMDDSAEAGHGTHVAGIIGAKGDNGIGISGISQTVSIIAMKIADSSGALVGDLAAMAKLVELKQTYGVNIVAANASYGGPMSSQAERDAISLLNSAGILLIAAAGNSSSNTDGGRRNFPSGYDLPNIVGVAATGNNDSLAYYSSYGKTSIDVAAPGGAMSSQTDPRGILSTLPNNTYGFYQGTSMATPYVTGLAALLKAAKPTATATEIRSAILGGVDKVTALDRFVATGGRINARKSIDLLLGNTTPTPTVSVANVSVTEGNTGTKSVQVAFTLAAAATSATTIAYRTAAGTAIAGSDFMAASGSLSIPAGSATGSVSITIVGDSVVEPDETFMVQVSAVNGTAVSNVFGTVTITNDDTPASGPVVNVGNTSIMEGNFGTPVMKFTVTLATAATRQTSVNYATSNGAAIAGEDYFAAKGTVTFKAGETSKTVDVRVVGDVRVESDETLTLTLSNPSGLTLGTATATGAIVNDDSASPPTTPTPPGTSGFQIVVRFPDNTLTSSQQQVFQTAAARWSQIITADLPDVGAIDDLEISATAPYIDGPGNILGSARPTAFRTGGTGLPYLGVAQFDSADMTRMERDGTLVSVVLHEMGHAIGIGSMWAQRNLVQGLGSTNPIYVGANAVREYNTIFGVQGNSVPAENMTEERPGRPGDGSYGSHWRESVMVNELMTSLIGPDATMPISRITLGSLQDLGYTVNPAAADAYTKPSAAALRAAVTSTAAPGAASTTYLLVAPRPSVVPVPAAPVAAGPRMASPLFAISPASPLADAPVMRTAGKAAHFAAAVDAGAGLPPKRLRNAAAVYSTTVSPLAGRETVFARLGGGGRIAGS